MRITVTNPVYTVVGSCDDKDPATGPGKNYSKNAAANSVTDGMSVADSSCLAATKLRVLATAQTANSSSSAVANAKAAAKSSLTISYSWFERILAFFGWYAPELAMQVVVHLTASVRDGPCGAGFTVFITNGPGGVNPVPSWQGLFGVALHPGDATKLDITRPNGIVETTGNPGQIQDWPDGPTIAALRGHYDLAFEANAVASADGTVSVEETCELVLYEP